VIVYGIAFYLFAAVAVASGTMVIAARNPVHSVLFLILAFFNAAALFVLMGAEFLAMVLVIVYVGAVAVLFLFVVMMLDINFAELRQGFMRYLPIGAMIGLVLLAELILVGGTWVFSPDAEIAISDKFYMSGEITNAHALGLVLYTKYVYLFQAAGLVLLVAMIGAIVLTFRSRTGVRRQKIGMQVGRRVEDSVELRKVKSREGV